MQLVDTEAAEADVEAIDDEEDSAEDVTEDDHEDDATTVEKRDLAGFDRALTFAEAALTKGPKVQLGTGKEGSGVGIIVENGPATASAAKAEGAAVVAAPAAAKRDVSSSSLASSPKRVRAKVTTMYVRSGIPVCELRRPFYR